MIGRPAIVDAPHHLIRAQLAAIDRLAARDDTRNDAKARGHARVVACGPKPLDHRGVKLIRAAIQIDIGARAARGQKGGAQRRRAIQQVVDKGIFGRPDRTLVQNAFADEARRVIATAVRGRKDDTCQMPVRQGQVIRQRRHEIVLQSANYKGK